MKGSVGRSELTYQKVENYMEAFLARRDGQRESERRVGEIVQTQLLDLEIDWE